MQKLFVVEAKAYVLAEDGATALSLLADDGTLPFDNGMSVEVNEAGSVDEEWWDFLPFGSDEATCGQIIADIRSRPANNGLHRTGESGQL